MGMAEAQAIRDEVMELYRRAWCETAFAADGQDLVSFGERYMRHCSNPDFAMVIALEDETVAGFAYGYTSVPGGWWRQAVSSNLPNDIAGRWFEDCFEFAELAVEPHRQRAGVGGALHDELLEDLPHQTAMLSTQEKNTAARRFYARRGWALVRDGFRFPHKQYAYVILGLDLTSRRVSAERGSGPT
jgi:GNAT superfamily N-acetyltransferase